MKDFFERYHSTLIGVSGIAVEVSGLIEEVSPFIQVLTDEVCPSCRNVCCINRHSRYEHDDIIYMLALGKEMIPDTSGRHDTAPCRFLSETGCSLDRPDRPYRCTWYFCSTLMDRFQVLPAPQYRSFIDSLNRITEKRKELMEEFSRFLSALPLTDR